MRLPLFLSLLPFLITQTTPPADDPPKDDPPPSTPPPDPEPEDVSGLKSALEKERAKRKQYETDLKAAREAQSELDRLKAEAKKKADEDAAAEGRYKELLEKREAELTELQNQLAEKERDDLRRTIAQKHNLKVDTAMKFLSKFDDEAEIEDAAKELAKYRAAEDVDTDSGKRTSTTKQTTKPGSLLASYTFGKRA